MEKHPPTLGKWRTIFWPVHTYELKKFLPMFLMFFFIGLVYNILRNLKDTFVLTAPGGSAEAILFIKLCGVLPAVVLFMLLYMKLTNLYSKKKVFFITLSIFLVFFLIFLLLLYPYQDLLHPHTFANTLQTVLPTAFAGLISAIRNWTYSVFYIIAELWASFMIALLFWGFANDITPIKEAKRFYPLLGLGANLSLYVAGDIVLWINRLSPNATTDLKPSHVAIQYLLILAILCGFIIMGIYYWMQVNVLTDPTFYNPTEQVKLKNEKPRLSLMQSFKFLSTSREVFYIAIMVMSYSIVINLIEISWKDQAAQQFPTHFEYSNFVAIYHKILAAATIAMAFVSTNLLRKMGWSITAYITPLMILITAIPFFSLIIFKDVFAPYFSNVETTPLMIALIIGTFQNIASRATKNSLFDPVKEIAFIPLDQESKVKGKAVVDTFGARLGKALGSGTQIGLLTLGSLSMIAPYLALFSFGIILVWLWAIRQLSHK